MTEELPNLRFNTVIIGGGPAGMMAALAASAGGNSVCIIEKNDRLGKKLRITGKGRCNITNDCDFDELMNNIPENGKFLFSCLKSYSNKDIMDFFNNNGCPTVTERGNRVFPASQKAVDVVIALKKQLDKCGVKIFYQEEPESFIFSAEDDGKPFIRGVNLKDSRKIVCKNVVIATGGASYPLTGSTGDGYAMAKFFGHTIIEPKASLIRLLTNDKKVKGLMGLTLKNIGIIFTLDNCENEKKRVIYEDFGELLFTGDGISGPIVLSGSRHLLKYDYRGITAHIDLKPALSFDKLEERIKRDFEEFSRKQLKNSMGELLPKAMIPEVIRRSGISEDKFVNQITKEERKKIIEVLKDFTVAITGCGPIEEAIVTAGGIKISEINPKTMESKLCDGLYFAGEVIDVDAYTGGFNLTIAFSTGHAAGKAIAEKLQQ